MTDFLTHAACCGIRPRKINANAFHHRPHLISKLMKERLVPRFIIAPDTLGKSMLACEYADTVFAYEHVFWIDGKSPCFLRDLDKGNLAEAVFEKDACAKLVVFDGIPLLDEARAEILKHVMDALLSRSCETIVTLTPSGDVFGWLVSDRACLNTVDLLLTDEEIEVAREMARRAGEPTDRFCASGPDENDTKRRIAGLAWGSDSGASLLRALAAEELLAESLAWMFVALVVRTGRMTGIDLLPRLQEAGLEALEVDYPFLGINTAEGEFSTVEFDVEVVAKAFAPRFTSIARTLHLENIEELHLAIARLLLVQCRYSDACRYIAHVGTRVVRERWLAENGRSLFLHGAIEASCAFFSSLRPQRSGYGAEACMVHAWRLQLFGENEEARLLAARVVSSPYAQASSRLLAALLISVYGEEDEQKKADASLRKLMGVGKGHLAVEGSFSNGSGYADAEHRGRSDTDETTEGLLARMRIMQFHLQNQLGRFDGLAPTEKLWCAWQREGVAENALIIGAIMIMRERAGKTCPQIVSFLVHTIEHRFDDAAPEGFDVLALSAADVLESCVGANGVDFDGEDEGACFPRISIDTEMRAKIAKARTELARQKQTFLQTRVDEARRRSENHRGVLRSNLGIAPVRPETAQATIPPLRVKLFGGMEVAIGGQIVEDAAFRRAKAKTMLALLVLAEGREVRAETLMDQMWPGSSITCARRSLYTVWSQLKKTLSLPDGSCPYVSKRQGCYRVENRYLVSDVTRANELCRGFMFQQEGVRKSRELLEECYEVFLGKLLPNEIENETIVRMRDDYHKRIVDILISASTALGREGKSSDALCFAACAFEADRTREDVYLALMRAQYNAGQRVQAMGTYMACREFLSEELGIDPSSEVERLYLSFLEDERV